MESFIKLTPYMYNIENSIKYKRKEKIKNEKFKNEVNIYETSKLKIFFYLYDELFNYDLNYTKINKKIIEILENINNYKNIFQKYNYLTKKKISDDLNNFNTKRDINLSTFSFLCTINDIYFIVKNKYFYFTNLINTEEIDYNIKKFVVLDEYNKTIKEYEFKNDDMNKYINDESLINIINPYKLIKPISNYKMCELNELVIKLKINVKDKLKKAELYEKIKLNIKDTLFFKKI